ncbi:MAG: hypothetical protein WC649_08630 [Desulfobacteria bacterium]
MALHPNFPESPHAILDPAIRWFPADEALSEISMEKLMPPLVSQLRRKVKEFRTKKDRKLELTSVFHECPPGRRKLAVKVVDIFGNDTMTIVDLAVGGKRQ